MARLSSWPQGVLFNDDANRRSLARAAAAGRLHRLAAGVYTGNLDQPLEQVTRRYLYEILGHERPGVVITDRSAKTAQPVGGRLQVSSARQQRDLDLPGLTVRVRRGPGPVEGDRALGAGVWLAGPARGLLDNLSTARGSASRIMPRAEVERWLEELLHARGEPYLGRLRDQARALALKLGREREACILDALIGGLLNTRGDIVFTDPMATARAAGRPIDSERLRLFAALASWLGAQSPNLLLDEPQFASRRKLVPFYDAYFSNFIEGTEFTLDEAADIALAGHVSPGRPEDSHDISGTFRLVSDDLEMRRVPRESAELLDLLRVRHGILLAGRPDMTPGRFKVRNNRAGTTIFVEPDLVEGTLAAGFTLSEALTDPFARAVYMMFFTSEVHSFADGNGRVSRIMMNAELVAAGQTRIIIPTIYRENYLAALRAASRTEHFAALYRTLDFARRWTARVDFSARATAEVDLDRTNALVDAQEAERHGIKLQLP